MGSSFLWLLLFPGFNDSSGQSSCPAPMPKVYSFMAGLDIVKMLRIMALIILLILFTINGRGPKVNLGTSRINRRGLLVVGRSYFPTTDNIHFYIQSG